MLRVVTPKVLSGTNRVLARTYCSAPAATPTTPPTPTPTPTPATPEEVIITKNGNISNILLNRPKALNALNANMVKILTPHYKALHAQREPAMVIMKGAGAKAFCAGGDIRAIYDEVVTGTGGNMREAFFREEYQLNNLIATLPHPHVALLNGITMGGGVGLSVHGKFRVATDNTVFAMPETGIGFFCDVGGTYFLPRLPGELGMYLGLTGARLDGSNIHQAGVATHYVPAERMAELENKLNSLERLDNETVEKTLRHFHVEKPDTIPERATIYRIFGKSSLDDVFAALRAENSAWSKGVLETLNKMSPTSLRVVFESLRAGKKLNTLADCLKMEYNISQAYMKSKESDFFEGVRALLVDKDKNPKWKADISTKDAVKNYLQYNTPTKIAF